MGSDPLLCFFLLLLFFFFVFFFLFFFFILFRCGLSLVLEDPSWTGCVLGLHQDLGRGFDGVRMIWAYGGSFHIPCMFRKNYFPSSVFSATLR